MPNYRYVGTECVYPNIIIPGEGSLVARPGDVREFDTPPDPVWWVEDNEAPVTPAGPEPEFPAVPEASEKEAE